MTLENVALLGVLFFVTLGLTLGSLVIKNRGLMIVSSGFWIITSTYAYMSSTFPPSGIFDIQYAIFFMCIGGFFFSFSEGFFFMTRKTVDNAQQEPNDIDKIETEMKMIERETRIPHIGRSRHKGIVKKGRRRF
jgi:hypothetical protein